MGRVHNVVLIKCIFGSGKPRGVLGIWKGEGLGGGWDRGGQFTSDLRPRWTDLVTARRVPSK